jgi:hypothetical protein
LGVAAGCAKELSDWVGRRGGRRWVPNIVIGADIPAVTTGLLAIPVPSASSTFGSTRWR